MGLVKFNEIMLRVDGIYNFIFCTFVGFDLNIQDDNGKTVEQVSGSIEVHACFMQNKIMKS